ncbi:MAG: hypothetical protein IT245_01690 [Bacteroidia bacterium]|nr:hypothetical protein [Bacteroidia bacterium]
MKILNVLILLVTYLVLGTFRLDACESTIIYRLENVNGGFFKGHTVTLIDLTDGKSYKAVANAKGEASLLVPCERRYKVEIDNYSKSSEIKSPTEGGKAIQSLKYSANMKELASKMSMGPEDIKNTDAFVLTLPDSFNLAKISNIQRENPLYFTRVLLQLTDLDRKPLSGEYFYFSGQKTKKVFYGVTGNNGTALIWLPKGDTYTLNFTYTNNFASESIEYTKARSEMDMHFAYLGSKEILKRIKAEEARVAAEEERLKKEKLEFEAWCKKRKVSLEDGMMLKLKENLMTPDTVVLSVLNRNKWKDKLIVCDLTGSMSPYASQLSLWYQLVYKTEKNLQFVFFNDGDNQSDNHKIIGKTGGIYYTPSCSLDSLSQFMAKVSAKGSGGDCPENNMEALIKGVNMARPYKELIMIADNYAPVKDIKLLKDFKLPVHIILCGAISGNILTDYLDIARKTGGSVHTIEEDIVNLASLAEGEQVTIMGKTYQIMGGKFIIVSKS